MHIDMPPVENVTNTKHIHGPKARTKPAHSRGSSDCVRDCHAGLWKHPTKQVLWLIRTLYRPGLWILEDAVQAGLPYSRQNSWWNIHKWIHGLNPKPYLAKSRRMISKSTISGAVIPRLISMLSLPLKIGPPRYSLMIEMGFLGMIEIGLWWDQMI